VSLLYSENNTRIRVLVQHEEPLLAQGIVHALENAGAFDVAIAPAADADPGPAEGAWRAARLAVADYDSGLRLRGHATTEQAILILTRRADEAHIRLAVERGIQGYLLHDCNPVDLVAALLELSRGGKVFAPAVTERLLRGFLQSPLTVRQMAILSQISRGRSNKEIAGELGLSTATVKTHVSAIMAKLGTHKRGEAAMIARRLGLIFDEDSNQCVLGRAESIGACGRGSA